MSNNLEFLYWNYPSFTLENIYDAECTAEVCFLKSDVYKLPEVLKISLLIKCQNRSVFNGLVCFCVFLKRFAYPCLETWLQDLEDQHLNCALRQMQH